MELRDKCIELIRTPLFDYSQGSSQTSVSQTNSLASCKSDQRNSRNMRTFTLSEFSIRLKAQKIECERQIDHFLANAEMIAKQACEMYLLMFLQDSGFNDPVQRGAAKLKKNEEKSAFDPEKTMTYTERATMRTQCRRITKFLRVVEFCISDALLQMTILSAERLHAAMERIKDGHQTDSTIDTSAKNGKKLCVVPLFRVDVTLRIGLSGVSNNTPSSSLRNGQVPPRFVRRNSGFVTVTTSTSSKSGFIAPINPPMRDSAQALPSHTIELLVFTPNNESLRSQLETLVFNGLTAVTNRARLLCSPTFKVYVEASRDDGVGDDDSNEEGNGDSEISSENMDMDILIMEDAKFVETIQGINTVIMEAYECVDRTCRTLIPFLDKFQANQVFCKQVAEQNHLHDADVDDFRDLLEKYTQDIQLFDRLKDSYSCGLLLLDTVELNMDLKPSPRQCLDALHKLLPIVINNKNHALMEELSANNDRISSIPTSVDEFAATLAYLRELQASMPNVDDKYSFLRSLYQLVEDFRIKITDNDQMNAFLLSQKRAQLKTSMDLFESSCEQYIVKFGVELETRIPGLAANLDTIAKSLAYPALFHLESSPVEMITYLSSVQTELTQLEEVVLTHFFHEKTLGLPQTTAFEELDDVKADLELKVDIWSATLKWNNAVTQWQLQLFPEEVDVDAIADQVEELYIQIMQWEKKLSPGMHVLCDHLKSEVEKYRVTMPILTDLRCPSFEERHFVELGTLLRFDVRKSKQDAVNQPRTLGELVGMHLSPYSQHVSRIATEATQERMLKEMLEKIAGIWERMEFEIKPYKDSKDFCVLVSVENIYSSLEESLVSMTAIMGSKYIAPIKDSAITWQRRLEILQETLDAWIECQRKWTHLESIFAAPDIQKQLPNEAVTFLGVNQFWKDIMRKTRDQRGCLKVVGLLQSGPGISNVNTGLATSQGQVLLEALLKHNASLELIEKSLEDYLETKRGFFPRFYFISNDELLDMLANAKEPQAVQRHLCKFFDALVKLEMSEDSNHAAGGANTSSTSQDVLAMISPEGERVAFTRSVKARGNVEDWLNVVLANMKTTLHKHLRTCLLDYQHASREMWLFRHPAQCVAVVSYIVWARECEICFRSTTRDPIRDLTLWHQTICAQLSNLTRLVRTALTKIQQSLVVSLVTTDVHFRDVVENLIAKKVVNAEDFVWTQQLRYTWNPEHDECDVMQANCRIKYGYEYMGACTRLVITPLTDRCWMTITGALELRFGAAPSGPAGTGKTETSKDLAKALGILCIVFNCSDQIDYKMVGKIFNGVIQAGCWTCLDEFNRIYIEVLSVIAQQMTILRHARLISSPEVTFEGKQVAMKDHHIIITMNPGYAGRTVLPDNLKMCFRPVAMMVPDYALIAEILLFAEGFQHAKPLSKKVTKLYKLCSEQLSQQPHYDFGMRAVKSVLLVAGTIKRENLLSSASALSVHDENMILINAMIDSNIPKFIDEDTQLFYGILKDLFPETITSSSGYDQNVIYDGMASSWISALSDEIDQQLKLHGLQKSDRWKRKILQLFATLNIRVGVVQTGASGSGKSTAMHILKQSLTALRETKSHPDTNHFQHVNSFTINPKCISMGELYGFFHPVTREWTDGLASSILRSCIMEKMDFMLKHRSTAISDNGSFYWITFDGPIDVLWIESMNTVLDDNMTLCLANGERIKLLPRIQLIFEVLDTASASPATISRLGVIYYDLSNLGWRSYVETWVASLVLHSSTSNSSQKPTTQRNQVTKGVRLTSKHKARILKYFDLCVEPGFAFMKTSSTCAVTSKCYVPIQTSAFTFVSTVCHLFKSLLVLRANSDLFGLASASVNSDTTSVTEEQQFRCLDLIFVFSFTWSFGGNLYTDKWKPSFQEFVYQLIHNHEKFFTRDLLAINGKISTPMGVSQIMNNVQDFFIDFNHLSFSPWENLPHQIAMEYTTNMPLFQVLVPTMDIVKYTFLTELLAIEAKKPIFLTGATGSGKSSLIHHLLRKHAGHTSTGASVSPGSGDVFPVVLHFSAQTSSLITQLSLESHLTKKRKTMLGPPVNTLLAVIFVDDVNLPNVETYGAQPPIELLRQYLEFKGLYDREKFFWKDIVDTVLIVAGGLPSGGRHAMNPRFIRHFGSVLCMPSNDETSMKMIYHTILTAHIACSGGFTKIVKDMILQLATTTCELFSIVSRELLPTPSKCHYLFNLRDVAKIMQGIVMGTRKAASLTVDLVAKLWAHEGIRVFRDRLMDEKDRKWFSEQLLSLAIGSLGLNWSLQHVYEAEQTSRTSSLGTGANSKCNPILFALNDELGRVDLMDAFDGSESRLYEEVTDMDSFECRLDKLMISYNATVGPSTPLQLVFFRDAMIHIAAISRVLMQPRGHGLLLGMGGSGKRSLAKLAAFMNGYRCVELSSKSKSDFTEDLKCMMTLTVLGRNPLRNESSDRPTMTNGPPSGRRNIQPTVMLLNDPQISDMYLEDINTLLNGGEIPKLFTLEEQEKIISDVRTLLGSRMVAQSTSRKLNSGGNNVEYSRKDCDDYFRIQVHKCMHIVLCLSPVGNSFRARIRQFPSIINCTTIDYFDEWPKHALQYVADRFLSQDSDNSTPMNNAFIKHTLKMLCVEVHQTIVQQLPSFFSQTKRKVYVTPQHYLDLIALYTRIFKEKKEAMNQKLQRLSLGVIKLEDTNALVSTLQNELVALQPILIQKTKEAEKLIHQVGIDQAEAGHVAQRVALDEAQVKGQQQEVVACQADAKLDLDQALPALNAAVSALDSLDKKDIVEVRAFIKPPRAVQVVMEAVCVMLGEKPDWDTSKRVLSRSTFMIDLKDYDKDNISPSILKRIQKYISNPEFAVDEVRKVSRAAMSLCMWVHAVDTYARIFKEVAPKRQRLLEMNTILAEANSKLEAKQQELLNVQEKVRLLRQQCDDTVAEKQRLIDESELTQARLNRAEKLTVGLEEERVRWKNSILQLKSEAKAIIGNSFLAAACISYLGPFDGITRVKLLRDWVALVSSQIEVTQPFTLPDAYGDSMELREWQLFGLPSDAISAENALCIMKGNQRWPLIIDPQQQANQWIKRLESSNRLEIVKSDDKFFLQTLEECLRRGKPLLIEDLGENLIRPLEPVLLRTSMNLATNPGGITVRLGERDVVVDNGNFRLYMTTKLTNPRFSPDVFIRVHVINFIVTREGLEDQLLGNVVHKEREEVEERKHKLLTSISQDQKLLFELEIRILSLLSDSKGNILDDIELIEALKISKETASVVTERLHESEKTKHDVLEMRNQYNVVAARGALLFFVIADLSDLDPMYQYSLEYFTHLFNFSLDQAPACSDLVGRLENLQAHLTLVVYQNICRGLFEAHKMLFSLTISLRIMLTLGYLRSEDIALLDRSTLNLDEDGQAHIVARRDSKLIPSEHNGPDVTDVLLGLANKSAVFVDVVSDYRSDPGTWVTWVTSVNPFESSLPRGWDDKISEFHKLVLVRWLREEEFSRSVISFIRLTLGERFMATESFDIAAIYRDMDPVTPCLFILSTGADPISLLSRFAREQGFYDTKYHLISLGQGQGPVAEAMLESCMQEGSWLVLQNLHLAKSWLPRFQQLLASMKEEKMSEIHPDFRLFLASFPADYFPISILQSSVKVICEPPKGMKANLQQSMTLLERSEELSEGSGKSHDPGSAQINHIERRLVFGLSLFHAVLQERTKFGTLGWNLKNDFSDADFLSVVVLLRRLLYDTTSSDQKFLDETSSIGSPNRTDADADNEENDSDIHTETGEDSYQSTQVRIPWDALHFLTGEIYYGGRVTDEFDRRCLMANLHRFCSSGALGMTSNLSSWSRRSQNPIIDSHINQESTTSLFAPTDSHFTAPEFESMADMCRYIDELPSSAMDEPCVFGMHPNAYLFYQKQECQRLVSGVLLLQLLHFSENASTNEEPTAGAGPTYLRHSSAHSVHNNTSERMEKVVLEIADDMLLKLPVIQLDMPASLQQTPITKETVDPFIVVLHQELSRCNDLVQYVRASLLDIQQAIQGLVAMSQTLEQVLRSLYMHQVPPDWRKQDGAGFFEISSTSSSSQPLVHWMHHLLFRIEFLLEWQAHGVPRDLVFPLSVFSFPQGLFTAILQRHARKHAIPIHHLDFEFLVVDDQVLNNVSKSEDEDRSDNANDDDDDGAKTIDGAYISGMFLEGAQWDDEHQWLSDPQPGVMHHYMPIIHVKPRAITASAPVATANAPSSASSATAKFTPGFRPNLRSPVPPVFAGTGSSRTSSLSVPADRILASEPENAQRDEHRYLCPVYKTPARKGALSTTGISSNFVLAIELPCERPADHYTLNGVALVCSRTF